MLAIARGINADVVAITVALRHVDQTFKCERFRTDSGGNALEQLKALVGRVQLAALAREEIDAHVGEMTEKTRVLFDRALPLFFRQAAELNWYRASVLGKCAELREFSRAAREFEPALGRLQADGIALSGELARMEAVLGISPSAGLAAIPDLGHPGI
jgi:hypothetical protein